MTKIAEWLAARWVDFAQWYIDRHPIEGYSPDKWMQLHSLWCPEWLQPYVFQEIKRR